MKRAALIAGVSIAALVCGGLSTASAWTGQADYRWGSSYAIWPSDPALRKFIKKRPRPTERSEPDRKAGHNADKAPAPKSVLHIIVSIEKQRATLFADGVVVASTAISSGTPSHPTPTGVFTIIQKSRHHVSNLYNASMPYMQRITWSGSALHEGPLPGYPASHGCVRLTGNFAQLLWKTTKMGARVIVTRPDVAPLEFEHARLFVPTPKIVELPQTPATIATATAMAKVKTADAAGTGSLAKLRTTDASQATVIAVTEIVGDATKPVVTGVVTEPVANAHAGEQPTKRLAKDGADTAAKPIAPAVAAVEPFETKSATQSVEPKPVVAAPVEDKTSEPTAAAAQQVQYKPIEAKSADARSIPTIAAPAPIIIDERPKTMPATVVREANGRPISVFVSLKEGKLYVRQGWKPLFETPVTFERPDEPVGTHVYTAMGVKTGGSGLRWTVVSIPSSTKRVAEFKLADNGSKDRGRKLRDEHPVKIVEVEPPMPSARTALDRLVMPQDVVERISEMITPGSSLIVSDNKLSDETGEYTDFIVLTR
jgi:hypothetical protein